MSILLVWLVESNAWRFNYVLQHSQNIIVTYAFLTLSSIFE